MGNTDVTDFQYYNSPVMSQSLSSASTSTPCAQDWVNQKDNGQVHVNVLYEYEMARKHEEYDPNDDTPLKRPRQEPPLIAPMKKRCRLPTNREELVETLESQPMQLFLLVLIIFDVVATVGETLVFHTCGADIHALEYTSIAILSAILLEQFLLMLGLGPKKYFRKIPYLIDVVVVLAALVMELVIENPETGLLALLLVWRGVRIVHGIILSVESGHKCPPWAQERMLMLEWQKKAMSTSLYVLERLKLLEEAACIIQRHYRASRGGQRHSITQQRRSTQAKRIRFKCPTTPLEDRARILKFVSCPEVKAGH